MTFFSKRIAMDQSFFRYNLLWENDNFAKRKWPKKFLNSVGHVKTFKTLFSHQSRSFDRLVECRPVIGHNYLKNNFCTVCLVYLLSLLKILIGSSLCPKQPFFSFRSPFIPSIFFCQTRTSSILYSFLPSPLCVY